MLANLCKRDRVGVRPPHLCVCLIAAEASSCTWVQNSCPGEAQEPDVLKEIRIEILEFREMHKTMQSGLDGGSATLNEIYEQNFCQIPLHVLRCRFHACNRTYCTVNGQKNQVKSNMKRYACNITSIIIHVRNMKPERSIVIATQAACLFKFLKGSAGAAGSALPMVDDAAAGPAAKSRHE